MGLRGDISHIAKLKGAIRDLPKTVAHDVAQRAAPAMTSLTRNAFTSAETVYGEPRPAGKGGALLTLHKTGATEAQLRFVSVGTIVRCVLGPKWARYLIGKYGILPNGALPAKWSKRLGEIVGEFRAPP